MELSGFVGQPCKTQLAFEFLPLKKTVLDVQKTSKQLVKAGFLIELDTPVFVAITVGNTSVSVFQTGKILVKDTKDREFAQKIAKKVVHAIS